MKTIGKISVLIIVLLLGLLFSVNHSMAGDKLKLALRTNVCSSVYVMGNFGKKYGLEIEAIPVVSGPDLMHIFVAGDVDIAETGNYPAASLASRFQDFYIIGAGTWGGGVYRIMAKPGTNYKSVAALKGKKIAMKKGSGAYATFLMAVKKAGLNEKDFHIINSGAEESIVAIESGAVDAVLYWEPTVSVIEGRGLGVTVVDFRKYALGPSFFMVRKDYADKNPEAVSRFMAGMMDVCELFTNNPHVAAELMALAYRKKGQKAVGEYIALGFPRFHATPWLQDFLKNSVKDAWKNFKRQGKLKGDEPKWDNIFTDRFLTLAVELRREKNVFRPLPEPVLVDLSK